MKRSLALLAPVFLALVACGSIVDQPTSEQAAAGLQHYYRLQNITASRPDVSGTRGNERLALMASNVGPQTPRSSAVAGPVVTDVVLTACIEIENGAVLCSATFRTDGVLQDVHRLRLWEARGGWRAHIDVARQ